MLLTRTDRHGITEYMALTFPPKESHSTQAFRSLLFHARAFALLASAWGHAANPY